MATSKLQNVWAQRSQAITILTFEHKATFHYLLIFCKRELNFCSFDPHVLGLYVSGCLAKSIELMLSFGPFARCVHLLYSLVMSDDNSIILLY